MKRRIAAICLAVLLVPAAALGQISFDGNIAFPIPTGDFADIAEPGFGVNGEAFVSPPLITGMEFGGRIGYNYFPVSDDFDDGSAGTIEILPSVRYRILPGFSPLNVFVQAGAGLYNWSTETEVGGLSFDSDGTDFGLSFGAGVMGKISPMLTINARPEYHIIFAEDENLTYIGVNIGLQVN